MKTITSMDFTVAVTPDTMSIEQDLLFIKSALLYADTITLVSPMASTYFNFKDTNNGKNEKTLFKLLMNIMPYCECADPEYIGSVKDTLFKFNDIINSKMYKSIPTSIRLPIKQALQNIYIEIKKVLEDNLGEMNCRSLINLVESKKVELYNFQTSLHDDDSFVYEFYDILKNTITDMKTFPLFDDMSNDLMKSAVSDGVITLNKINEEEAKHAKLANNLLVSLPSFEFASVDEILDIRSELEKPLFRFRSKLLSYNEKIQSMPWDDEFQYECIKLYQQEVAPAVLEIDEITKESSFIKNLGYSFLTDETALKNAGELIITVTMAGVISTFTDVLSSGQALLTAGGAYTATKIAKAYKEYRKTQHEIMKKDMYFYHRTGKLLIEKRRK